MTEPRPRVGVRRRACPHPVAATAEARVVRHELERRLGGLTLDLRVEAERPVGPWAPLEHAAWPSDVDALVEPPELFGDDHPPLTTLFARTVEPRAADVRRRMLEHLGVIDGRELDDDAMAGLDPLSLTPTDVWLIATAAPAVAVSDPSIAALATSTDADRDRLDGVFDAVAARLRAHDLVARSAERTLERTRAELADARARCGELADRLARERSRADAVIDLLGSQVAAHHLDDPGRDDPGRDDPSEGS